MSLFSKLNQIKDMRSQAKQMQKNLSQEIVEVEKEKVILKIDGNQKIQDLKIPEEIDNKELEKIIPDLFEQATKKLQKMMMEKMKKGEISMPDLNL